MDERTHLVHEVVEAAKEAGQLIEQVRASGFSVEQKAGQGPVTEADRAADSFLRTRLLALAPGGWLSEETADDAGRLSQQRLWVVDPLDGTKEFVKGLPEYCIAIGLVDQGDPVIAVVHNPATNDTFWAVRGGGAFRGGERIRVQEGPRLLASRSELKRGEFDGFLNDWELTPIGSIQLKLALVAAGEASVTLSRGPKHEWDVCAGALLVAESGGTVTDAEGAGLRYNQAFPKVRGILAGAPSAWCRAMALVRSVGVSDRMQEFAERDAGNRPKN